MPQLKFKGMEKEDVKKISKELLDDLEAIIKCPRIYFTIEVMNSTFICDGEETKGLPLVEVAWFDRGQEVQDLVAKAITKRVQSTGNENVDIIFNKLEKKSYYENGEHF